MAKFIIAILVSFLLTANLYADGEHNSDWIAQPKDPKIPSVPAVPDATPNQASDASFDKRLPPVLPGERVNDSGREMKVWSSSGPVPVADEPEPWNRKQNDRLTVGSGNNGSIGVIIDERKGRKRKK